MFRCEASKQAVPAQVDRLELAAVVRAVRRANADMKLRRAVACQRALLRNNAALNHRQQVVLPTRPFKVWLFFSFGCMVSSCIGIEKRLFDVPGANA